MEMPIATKNDNHENLWLDADLFLFAPGIGKGTKLSRGECDQHGSCAGTRVESGGVLFAF